MVQWLRHTFPMHGVPVRSLVGNYIPRFTTRRFCILQYRPDAVKINKYLKKKINYKFSSYSKNTYEFKSFHPNISTLPKVFFSLTRQSLSLYIYIYIYSYNAIIGIYYLLETEKYSKGVAGMGFSSKSSSSGARLLFQILGMMEPPWRGLLGKWKQEVNTGCGRGELQTVPVTREHTCFDRKR